VIELLHTPPTHLQPTPQKKKKPKKKKNPHPQRKNIRYVATARHHHEGGDDNTQASGDFGEKGVESFFRNAEPPRSQPCRDPGENVTPWTPRNEWGEYSGKGGSWRREQAVVAES